MSFPPQSIPLTGAIGTTALEDVFPTHYDSLGSGGMRAVAHLTARDAIPVERRVFGMLVFVVGEGRLYVLANSELGGSSNYLDDNSNWRDFAFTGGSSVKKTIVHTTQLLAVGEVEDFTIASDLVYNLLSITTLSPAWVRVYGTSAARDADIRTEPGGTPPTAGSEFYAEIVTAPGSLSIRFSPVPTVQSTNGISYIRIVNMDTVSQIIGLEFVTLGLLTTQPDQGQIILHMDGEDNSSNFIDSGENSLSVTVNGTPKISTAHSVFGGASAYFDGSTGYLSLENSDLFNIAGGDFTITMRIKIVGGSGYCGLTIFPSGEDHGLYINRGTSSETSTLVWYDPNGFIESDTEMIDNQWYSVAVSRRLGVLKIFIDGEQEGGFYANSYPVYGPLMLIGSYPEYEENFNGYIDEFLFDRTALYLNSFTPPTQPF